MKTIVVMFFVSDGQPLPSPALTNRQIVGRLLSLASAIEIYEEKEEKHEISSPVSVASTTRIS